MVLSTTWVFLPKWPISLCSDSDFLGLVRFVPLGKNTQVEEKSCIVACAFMRINLL